MLILKRISRKRPFAGQNIDVSIIMEDEKMRKAVAGIVVVLFAGMLCSSLLAAFNSPNAAGHISPLAPYSYIA